MSVYVRQRANSLWRARADEIRERTGVEVTVAPDDGDVERDRVDVLITFGESEEALSRFPNLRAVVLPVAGVNHLPFDALARRGIAVANAHGNGKYVAERAVALLLAFFGKIVPFHNDLANGRWHGFAASDSVTESWDSIFGARVAILGTGSIGTWTARLLRPFEVQTVGFNRCGTVQRDGTEQAGDGDLFHSVTTSLDEAIDGADSVVVTLPLTDATRGLIGGTELRRMAGAVLVNVGRARIVQEEPLYNALLEGTLRGAAIDTWYDYPAPGEKEAEPSGFPFHELDNVVFSPHVGGFTPQATEASIGDAVENVVAFLNTGALVSPVDAVRGY